METKKYGQACKSKLTKDDYSFLSNYRPVSLLSCVCIVTERIVFKHLYFYSNDIFINIKPDFYQAILLFFQLFETYDDIVRKIDEGNHVACCFTINHKPLIEYFYLNQKCMVLMEMFMFG